MRNITCLTATEPASYRQKNKVQIFYMKTCAKSHSTKKLGQVLLQCLYKPSASEKLRSNSQV